MRRLFVLLAAGAVLIGAGVAAFHWSRSSDQVAQSPYVDQLASPVRGLSPQEVDDLLNGRGAGYARTAELNDHPGPRHVLDLRTELALSSDQISAIETAFGQMDTRAKQLGQTIVDRERELSAAFAAGTLSAADLETRTADLAALYGQLRATHLEAHLAITPLLSSDQIAAYNELRGYTGNGTTDEHQHDH